MALDLSAMSASDQKTLSAAFQSFEVQPKVDFEKMKAILGSASIGAAQVRWYTFRKRILGGDIASLGGGDGGASTTKGKGKKRKAAAEEDDKRADSASPAPKKAGRKSKAKKAQDAGSDDDIETTIPPRQIKRARKPKAAEPETSSEAKAQSEDVGDDENSGDIVKTEVPAEEAGMEGKFEESVIKEEADDEEIDADFLQELNAYAERAKE